MDPYLNFHTHREAVPGETVIRNLLLPAGKNEEDAIACSFFSAGIHPWHLPPQADEALRQLARFAAHPRCIAIGETGLDKICPTPLALQLTLFEHQLALACTTGRPAVIHCVKAWDELLATAKRTRPTIACVVHGFRGKPRLAENLLTHDFYLSFGPRFNPESLRLCPPERLFLETDEDPHSVDALYHIAASLRGCSPENLNAQCLQNLRDITQAVKK